MFADHVGKLSCGILLLGNELIGCGAGFLLALGFVIVIILKLCLLFLDFDKQFLGLLRFLLVTLPEIVILLDKTIELSFNLLFIGSVVRIFLGRFDAVKSFIDKIV